MQLYAPHLLLNTSCELPGHHSFEEIHSFVTAIAVMNVVLATAPPLFLQPNSRRSPSRSSMHIHPRLMPVSY